MRWPDREVELKGGVLDTTNNRMEMSAAIYGLLELPERSQVTLWTDSEYVQKGMTEYRWMWEARKWHKVKNVDLWAVLLGLNDLHEITWKWCKGHAGNIMNERVDKLALAGRLSLQEIKS